MQAYGEPELPKQMKEETIDAKISRLSTFGGRVAAYLGMPALAADAPWRIGFVSATSGPLKETGDFTAVAIKLAVDEINAKGGVEGHKLDFIQYDTSSDPRQASVAVRTLAEDKKVLAIVGPLSSAETAVAANDAERLQILMLPYSSSAPGITDGKKFTWRLFATEDKQFARLLTSMHRKNVAMKMAISSTSPTIASPTSPGPRSICRC